MEEIRTRAGQAARRRLAVDRVASGILPARVAAVLGVHVETVRLWVRTHRAGGDAALAGTPHPGRRSFLTPAQQARVLRWLADPPTAHGFRTDLWTAGRVAELIRRRFGVTYHPGYLREWLSKRGYSPQKPARPAREKKPEAVARWVRADWPRVQKKRRPTGPTSS
jgi:transposase